jgi:hypothetical protein
MAPLIAAMLPMLSNTAGLFCIATTGFILLYAVDQLLLAPRKPSPAVFACEPEGKKSVSIQTRLAFYLNCVGLYHEAWERVSSPPLASPHRAPC